MEIVDWFLILACIFCFRAADSFVVTKYDPDTIIKYFNLLRGSKEADEGYEAFRDENVPEFCHKLRQSKVFEFAQMPLNQEEEIPPTYHRIPANLFEIERNQRDKHVRRFRIQNTNKTMKFHSFQCLNFERELKWIITSAFMPDSAFLFEVEPNFRNLAKREIDQKDEISARLVGLIDRSGGRLSDFNTSGYENTSDYELFQLLALHSVWKLVLFYTRLYFVCDLQDCIWCLDVDQRDPLCDLNRILQYRICALVADVRMTYYSNISEDHRSTQMYQYQDGLSFNLYYPPEDRNENCRKPAHNALGLHFRHMLYCSVRILGSGPSFYIASNVSPDPSDVFFFTQQSGVFINNISYLDTIWSRYTLPLLWHLEKYNDILGNADI